MSFALSLVIGACFVRGLQSEVQANICWVVPELLEEWGVAFPFALSSPWLSCRSNSGEVCFLMENSHTTFTDKPPPTKITQTFTLSFPRAQWSVEGTHHQRWNFFPWSRVPGRKSIRHRGTPRLSVCRPTPRSQRKKKLWCFPMSMEKKQGKNKVHTIGLERRVHTIEASDPAKEEKEGFHGDAGVLRIGVSRIQLWTSSETS